MNKRRTSADRRTSDGPSSADLRLLLGDERRLCDQVKRVYTLHYRMRENRFLNGAYSDYIPPVHWDGKTATLERAPRSSMWARISDVLKKRQVGPTDYLARQFDQISPLERRYVSPGDLIGDEAWARYRKSRATTIEDVVSELRWQTNALRLHARFEYTCSRDEDLTRSDASEGSQTMGDCTLYALARNPTEFAPLFNYIAAFRVSEEYPESATWADKFVHRFAAEAAIQYVSFRQEYDAVWRELIPKAFRENADRIYQAVLGNLF